MNLEQLLRKCKCSKVRSYTIGSLTPDLTKTNSFQVLSDGGVVFVTCSGEVVEWPSGITEGEVVELIPTTEDITTIVTEESTTRTLAQFYNTVNNISNTVTDLFTYTMPAGTMSTNGDMLEIDWGGNYVTSGATIKFRTSFDGNETAASQFSITGVWRAQIRVIRVTNLLYRLIIQEGSTGFGTTAVSVIDAATDFSDTIGIKLRGIGTASNQLYGFMGSIKLLKAA